MAESAVMPESVEQLRAYIDAEFRHRDVLRAATEKASEKALEIAQDTLNHRLDKSNGMKEVLEDTVNTMMPRAEADQAVAQARSDAAAAIAQLRSDYSAAVALVRSELQTSIGPLAAKVETYGKPNVSLLTAIGSFVVAAIGGAWLIFGLEIRAEIAPLMLSVEQIKVSNAGRDVQIGENRTNLSRLDQESSAQGQRSAAGTAARVALTADVKTLQENFTAGRATRAATEASMKAKLTEIETQFCASDQLRNVMHAVDMRNIAMLWHNAFPSSTMPTDNAYYPRVCNRVVESN